MIRYLFVMFLSVVFLFAKNDIIISNEGDKFTEFSTQRYEDKSAKLSFEEIQKIDNFKDATNSISEGYTSSSFWIKFSVYNDTNKSIEYYLRSEEMSQDRYDCYIVSNDSTYIHYKAGAGYFSTTKVNKPEDRTFKVDINAYESKLIYMRISSRYPTFTAFYFYNKDMINEHIHTQYIICAYSRWNYFTSFLQFGYIYFY